MLKRWRLRKRTDEPRAIVLGEQLASARRAEELHRSRHPDVPSPLSGIEYENEQRGTLQPISEQPADGAVRQLVQTFRDGDGASRPMLIGSLTMEDFYGVRQFAIRSAERALQDAHPGHAFDGLCALAMIDMSRIDPRDISWAASFLRMGLTELVSVDVADEQFRAASELAEDGTAVILRSFVGMTRREAGEDFLLEILEFDGRKVLIERGLGPFQPTVDLVGAIVRLAEILVDDGLLVGQPVIGEVIGHVWLDDSPGSQDVVAQAVASVSLRVLGREEDSPMEQMFLPFIFELPTTEDAELFEKSWQAGTRKFASLAVTHGRLLALIIARSSIVGVASRETDGSLRRFAPAFTEALRSAGER